MGENLLDLSTIVDRPTVTIKTKRNQKGKLYELASLADLGPYEYAQMITWDASVKEINERSKGRKLTAAEKRKLAKALDDSVKLICPTVEPSVLADLTDQQKQNIVLAWSAYVTRDAEPGKA